MDEPGTTPTLQRPTMLLQNQLELAPITFPLDESNYTSLDAGVFETVKDLHRQLESFLKSLPLDEKLIHSTVDSIVALNCPLPAKFSKVNVSDLLKKNKNVKGDDSLVKLEAALGLLEKYGRNLLIPKRPVLWKFINFANSVFRTRVDIIKGAREILQLMGYSEVVEDGLSFPSDVESADRDRVAVVTADLAIAKMEIEMYRVGQHPYSYRVKDCLDGTMAMIQLPGNSPSGHPKSFFVRRPNRGQTIYENVPTLPGQSSKPIEAAEFNLSSAPVPSKPKTYTISEDSLIEGIVNKIGHPGPASKLPANVGFGYFAKNSECVLTVENAAQYKEEQPLKTTSTEVHISTQPGPKEGSEHECVMCGKTTANMQCFTCSGLRCESCDKQWHLHPNRRIHQRQEVKAVPIFPPMIPCSVCGTEQAKVLCRDCSSSYCSNHDNLYHMHPQRMNHIREPLVIDSPSQTATSPPKNIVLSPVEMPAVLQDPSRTSESSSASIKRRPVPTPRAFLKKTLSSSGSTEPAVIPRDPSESDDNMIKTTISRSDLKIAPCPSIRSKSETVPLGNTFDSRTSPEPFYSLPANTKSVLAQVEGVVKKDIAVLQKIRDLRSALVTEGFSDTTLKDKERQLLEEHTKLLKQQKELEESMDAPLKFEQSTEQQQKVTEHPAAQPTHVASQIKYPSTGQSEQKTQDVPSTGRRSTSPPVPPKPVIALKPQPVIAFKPQPVVAFKPQPAPPPVSQTPASNMTTGFQTSTPPAVQNRPRFTPRQHITTVNTAQKVVRPGGAQQPANTNRLTSPDSPVSGGSDSSRPEVWLCPQCGNHNASTECMSCRSPMPPSSTLRPSVAALSQQLKGSIRMPVPQGYAKPNASLPQKANTESSAAAAVSSPPPLQKIFVLQQIDEIVLEKQRAKEEDERKQATEREKQARKQAGSTHPIPPPRLKKLQQSFGSDLPSSTTTQPSLNQTTTGLAHVVWTEDKKRLEEQRAQSLSFIKLLRAAEGTGYLPEEVVVATESINRNGGHKGQEVQWLEENWKNYVETVIVMASNLLKKEVGLRVEMVTKLEALAALRKHSGNVEKAVEECVADVQRRVLSLVDFGFAHQRVYESLAGVEGKTDDALVRLNKGIAKPYADRIWLPEDIVAQEQMIIALGLNDKQAEIVERRIRLLLADYELPSWGRAVTAARLIDTKKYETGDAIIAAHECGDLQRATQYLEKTCSICYAEFPMNRLSTLINCQCTICLECLENHFTVLMRDRNILNATCPACDLPDLQGGDHEFVADYFGFLDLLLKGLLDERVYGLFQDKLLNWNLMQQDNFRWCANCGNGFINEAPNRRKMRCPECNHLTCFQCKKPWMDQHENISCDDFQDWKEANDPNAQLQGLAIHLKENGIDCPKCKMRYELAKGGCMHFKCVTCTHEFCSGCNSPFRKDCCRFATCQGKGLHAHHPRDCLFYLRDLDINTLKTHLKKHNVNIKRTQHGNQEALCSVMEQKDGPEGLIDDRCGRDNVHAGLCELHYKEYLVSKMNQNHIDPADEFNVESLKIILQRNDIAVPAREEQEPMAGYCAKLLRDVKLHLPLEEKNPRDRSQSA